MFAESFGRLGGLLSVANGDGASLSVRRNKHRFAHFLALECIAPDGQHFEVRLKIHSARRWDNEDDDFTRGYHPVRIGPLVIGVSVWFD